MTERRWNLDRFHRLFSAIIEVQTWAGVHGVSHKRYRHNAPLQYADIEDPINFSYFNPQPNGRRIGDCTVRALAKALDQSWEKTYVGLCLEGFLLGDLPNADIVWGNYLFKNGFRRRLIPDDGLGIYTVSDFANDHPIGTFVLSMPGRHVVTVVDSIVYDSWDSRDESPSYYFYRKYF